MTMAVAQVVGCTIESNLGPGVLVRSSPSPVEVHDPLQTANPLGM